MYRKIALALAVFTCTWATAQRAMTEAESREFVSQFTRESKKLQTMQSDFTQTKKVNLLNKPIISSGKMAFQAPNLLHWQYTKPNLYSIVFKDNKVFINDKGKKTSVDAKGKMFEKISQLIVGSANGNLFSSKDFSSNFFQDGNTKIARLTPKVAQLKRFVQQVEIHFKGGQSIASKIIMTEKSGDIMQIDFSNTQINTPISSASFAP